MSTYNKDQEQDSNRTSEKFNAINLEMERLSSTCEMVTKNTEMQKESISNLNSKVEGVQNMVKSNLNENMKIRSTLQEMAKNKSNSLNESKFNRKEISSQIEKVVALIKAESEARKLFNKDLEEKYSNIETDVKLMKNESKHLQSKISEKVILPELESIKQNIQLAGPSPDISQSISAKINDPEVKGQVEAPIKLEQQSTFSKSVLNYEHKDADPTESHQLSTSEESNTTVPTKVNNSSKVKQPNISELIVRGSFDYFQLITSEIFQVIYSLISSGMA